MALQLPSNPTECHQDPAALFSQIMDYFAQQADAAQLRTHIPPRINKKLDTKKFVGLHHTPEIFLQLQGAAQFTTPAKSFRLLPGQMALISPLVAHHEKTMRWRGKGYACLVVMLSSDQISIHIAVSGPGGMPTGQNRQRYSGKHRERIISYLADAARFAGENAPADRAITSGSAAAALGLIRKTLEMPINSDLSEHPKITMCKNICQTHLSDPKLNVSQLAKRVGCSADYLSNLFSRQTGEHLSQWLCRQRIDKAKQLLVRSTLNISEIAWATGFDDPAYLSRCFKNIVSLSPRKYRTQKLKQQASK